MKILKSFELLMTVVALVVLIILAGSAKPSCASEPLLLKVAIYSPKINTFTSEGTWIMKEVEKRHQGRIKFEYYYSGTLFPGKEALTGLQSRVGDISFFISSLSPGKVPLLNVATLPMTGKHYYSTAMALAEFMEKPEIKAELNVYNVMYLSPLQISPFHLWSRSPIRSVAELKGKKIRTLGWEAKLLRALGGVPISMIATETYTALERGTLDGAMGTPNSGLDYKWNDVCPYFSRFYFSCKGLAVIINKDSWSKIPADIQKTFKDLREPAVRYGYEIYDLAGQKRIADMAAKGKVTIIDISAKDLALMQKISEDTLWKEWVKSMDEKGLPGQKTLETWLGLVKKWEAKDPFAKTN